MTAADGGFFRTLFVVFMFATWFVLTLAILCVMEVSLYSFLRSMEQSSGTIEFEPAASLVCSLRRADLFSFFFLLLF